jgi:phosphohistidine swiveling domain-containing protein
MTETDVTEAAVGPHPDKWPRESGTPIVEHYHRAVRKLVAERLARTGKAWEEVVHHPALELTREDFEKIEADLLATGYRFTMSAVVSVKESPEKYKAVEERAPDVPRELDEEGRPVVGRGDNVFRLDRDISGTARFVSTVETVIEMLQAGVPDGTIAVIDDSGGTLTAPVLGKFAGVVCLGGTVRSHLGILTREYGVPCLMAAEVNGLQDGDQVTIEYSKPAADAYGEADAAAADRPRIIRLS